MFRLVVLFIEFTRHIPPEVSDERRLQLRKRPPQQQRIHARMLVRLQDRFVEQRFGLPGPRRAAEKTILRRRIVKFFLPRKWFVKIFDLVRALPPCGLGFRWHGSRTGTLACLWKRGRASGRNSSNRYVLCASVYVWTDKSVCPTGRSCCTHL